MSFEESTHVYGPVFSRRLGHSLGLDLVPLKACSYDCLYCQLGRTTDLTVNREEFVRGRTIAAELEAALAEGIRPDYITVSGSGEPTLHAGLGKVIRQVKEVTNTPVAVLTNGSLLWRPEVRRAVGRADLVLPSLDAGDELMFRRVNRPHASLTFEQMLRGLQTFVAEYPGEVWLEVFLMNNINADWRSVEKIADAVRRIKPTRVQLNTVSRPPGRSGITAVLPREMRSVAPLFDCPVDIISETIDAEPHASGVSDESIVNLLRRRPCTARGIADGLGMHINEVVKHLQVLLEEDKVYRKHQYDRVFYTAKRDYA